MQVTNDGGDEPLWSRDGKELFYRDGTKIMMAQVQTNPLSVTKPKLLFEGTDWITGRDYDITADGKRFIMIRGEKQTETKQLSVVMNWFEEVKQKVR